MGESTIGNTASTAVQEDDESMLVDRMEVFQEMIFGHIG